MPFAVVVTCKECHWKQVAKVGPVCEPTNTGREFNFAWREVKIENCPGCGHNRKVRLSVKTSPAGDLRQDGISAPVYAPTSRARQAAGLKRGRPKIPGPRPWDLEGVSRRTWYRWKS
jgi:hypothetical protein